jgi:serine/alanine adding enzyme
MTGLREVESRGWDELLADLGLGDAYLSRGYVEAAAHLDPGRPTLLHIVSDGGDIVFPLILREIPKDPELHDATTPYGYGGPVATGVAPPWREFHDSYGRWCRENRVVSTFFRFHPLYANHTYASPPIDVVQIGETIGWDIGPGTDVLANMDKGHRWSVRKALGSGVSFTATAAPESLALFARLYGITMRRVNAAPYYFFPDAYWESLVDQFADRLVLFEAALGGTGLAYALCLATQPWLHYHLSATDAAARSNGASQLLLYEAARWGQERGFDIFHLGGGVGGKQDSLYEFKRRFGGGGERPAFIGKQIHDPNSFRRLAGTDSVDGFFPAYRRPRPS